MVASLCFNSSLTMFLSQNLPQWVSFGTSHYSLDLLATVHKSMHSSPLHEIPSADDVLPLDAKGAEKQLKLQLCARIGVIKRDRQLSENQMARLAGTPPATIGRWLHGRITGTELMELLLFLNRLGHSVDIAVSSQPVAAAHATLKVRAKGTR